VKRSIALAVVLALLTAACGTGSGGTPGAGGSGSPAGSAGGSPGTALTPGQLRVAVMTRLGPRWWCDPDFYPIARSDEQALAIQHFAEMQAEGDVFGAVVAALGLTGTTTFTDAQKLAIYQLWKAASTFPFDPTGDGRFRFDYVAQPPTGGTQGTHTTGTIAADGAISIDQQQPAGEPNCPICLARGTLIDTPNGPVAVELLRLGDPVWTLDAAGRRIAGTVIALGSTPAPIGHVVIRVTLADGRSVTASAGHPLVDGRRIGDLVVGEVVDGSPIADLEPIAYTAGETFDLVASGPTGAYLAGGIPLASTLLPGGWAAPVASQP